MLSTVLASIRRRSASLRDRWYRTDATGRRHRWDAIIIDSPEGGYLGGIPGDHSADELQAHIDDLVAASRQVLRDAGCDITDPHPHRAAATSSMRPPVLHPDDAAWLTTPSDPIDLDAIPAFPLRDTKPG